MFRDEMLDVDLTTDDGRISLRDIAASYIKVVSSMKSPSDRTRTCACIQRRIADIRKHECSESEESCFAEHDHHSTGTSVQR